MEKAYRPIGVIGYNFQAMICFLFAMEKEAAPLLEDSQILEATLTGNTHFYLCEKNERKYLVGITGIGKVFAGSAVAEMRLKYPTINAILNIGVGGSLDAEKAPLLSLVIGEKYVEHDFDTTSFGDPLGLLPSINKVYLNADPDLMSLVERAAKKTSFKCAKGTISTGDRFIEAKEDREALKKRFNSLSCDMESGAMAQIAYVYQIPFCAARVVSDTGVTPNEYAENWEKAAKLSKTLIDSILGLL